jgi:8-oxo-dGTP pyrophosphatase MutT (NUDIX family)
MFQIVHQQMSDGKTVKTFEIARRAPGTRIIFARGRDFLLTREFRYELDRYDYRLPGGKVFDRLSDYQAALAEGVDIVDAAREAAMREAREEVGLEPIELQPWAVSACGATVKWDLYFFVCRAFNQLGGVHHESGEDLSHDWYSFDEVRAMCLDGRIDEERSAIQLLKVMAKEILV